MHYLGGKARIAKPLAAYLESRREGRYFVEPFCGGLNITAAMSGPRLASDIFRPLLSLYSAVRAGWEPPPTVDEDLYSAVRLKMDPEDPMTAFVGIGCSFSGKMFGGLARSGSRNYAANAWNSLRKKVARCADATFSCASYEALNVSERCLVYCDPPYEGTTGYKGTAPFDSDAFWQRCREWAKASVTVLVSEYSAPPDFKVVWEIASRTDMHGKGRAGTVERLFEYGEA